MPDEVEHLFEHDARDTCLACEPAAVAYTGLDRLRAIGDPERDARIVAYRDRERRRAVAALDRFLVSHEDETLAVSQVAGERFVEAVGDYVLSRLHHSGHYGVTGTAAAKYFGPADSTATVCRNAEHDHFPGDPVLPSCTEGEHHSPAYGATVDTVDVQYGVGVTGRDIRDLCECGHPIGESHFEDGCRRLIGSPAVVCECTRSLSSLLAEMCMGA